MTFVFIVGSYYPFASAVGNCAFMVARELAHKHKVIILSEKNISGQSREEIYKQCLVIRVTTSENEKRLKYLDSIEKNNLSIIWSKFMMYSLRVGAYLKALVCFENIDQKLIAAYEQELLNIGETEVEKEERIILIPCCFPFESVIAAIKYKKERKNVLVIPYLFDRFSDSATLHRLKINRKFKWKRHLSLEESMLINCDKLLYISSWKDHLLKYFDKYSSKFVQIEHPLLCDIETDKSIEFDMDKINIVYTGALLKKERSPQYVFNILRGILQDNINVNIHLFAFGDCGDTINKLKNKYPKQIFNYGNVDIDTAHAAMLKADILLAVGNKNPTQVSSKVFEYISARKPIIFSYKDKSDPLLTILKNYPCCYMLDENTNITRILHDELSEFITNRHCVDSENLDLIFYNAIPKYTSDIIEKSI